MHQVLCSYSATLFRRKAAQQLERVPLCVQCSKNSLMNLTSSFASSFCKAFCKAYQSELTTLF